jgi:hypothetical protein
VKADCIRGCAECELDNNANPGENISHGNELNSSKLQVSRKKLANIVF